MSFEAESAVLGSILRDAHLIEECYLKPEEFIADPRHGMVIKTLRYAWDKFESLDLVVMAKHWGNALDKIGGISYLMRLRESVSTTEGFVHHLKIVRDTYVEEEMRRLTAQAAEADEFDAPGVMAAISELQELSEQQARSGPMLIKNILEGHALELTNRAGKRDGIQGARTALKAYDTFTGGHQRETVTVIAARPSFGKTQYVLNDMYNAARGGNPVVLFSLEMSKKKDAERLIAMIGGIDHDRIRSGLMSDSDWDRYSKAMDIIDDLPIYIDDSPGQTVEYIERQIKRLVKFHPGLVVYVDFVQLVGTERGPREEKSRTAYVSQRFMDIKKKYKVPLILISAMNRDIEKRQDKRPLMSDLRESGSLESDADVIAFLHREDKIDPNSPLKGFAEIIIAKGRDVGTGSIFCVFNEKNGRFSDITKEQLYELRKAADEYKQANRKR